MNLKKKAFSVLALLLTLMILWLVMKRENGIPSYLDFGVAVPDSYNLLGIDVSHHQGDIYWEEVDNMSINGDSIQFAFIKASEGDEFDDPQFKMNAKGVEKINIPYGFYHYYHPSVGAVVQADFFVGLIKEFDYKLKPVVDIELISDYSSEQLSDSLLVFISRVEYLTGDRPLVYTYESFYKDYLGSTPVSKELFWIASYNSTCSLIEEDNVLLWQFSESGTVNGIRTKVDLNIAKEDFFEKSLR